MHFLYNVPSRQLIRARSIPFMRPRPPPPPSGSAKRLATAPVVRERENLAKTHARTAPLDSIWAEIDAISTASDGMSQSVVFCRVGGGLVAVKVGVGAGAEAEWLGAQVAGELGCLAPACRVLRRGEAEGDALCAGMEAAAGEADKAALRRSLALAGPDGGLLVMDFVKDSRPGAMTGEGVADVCRLIAFDLIVMNTDRLPLWDHDQWATTIQYKEGMQKIRHDFNLSNFIFRGDGRVLSVDAPTTRPGNREQHESKLREGATSDQFVRSTLRALAESGLSLPDGALEIGRAAFDDARERAGSRLTVAKCRQLASKLRGMHHPDHVAAAAAILAGRATVMPDYVYEPLLLI